MTIKLRESEVWRSDEEPVAVVLDVVVLDAMYAMFASVPPAAAISSMLSPLHRTVPQAQIVPFQSGKALDPYSFFYNRGIQ